MTSKMSRRQFLASTVAAGAVAALPLGEEVPQAIASIGKWEGVRFVNTSVIDNGVGDYTVAWASKIQTLPRYWTFVQPAWMANTAPPLQSVAWKWVEP